jgi:hypothetical protein
MKSVMLAVMCAGGMLGGFASAETVTIAPALRAGDVARSSVLTTVAWDMPESDDTFMRGFMQDTLATFKQDITWTVRRVEPTYSVIAQDSGNVQTAMGQPESMMSRMMLLGCRSQMSPLECRVSKAGEIEDVLNAGELAEQYRPIANEVAKTINDKAKDLLADPEINNTLNSAFDKALNSSDMHLKMMTMLIGKPLHGGSWLWGKTLTVGEAVTMPVPASELSFGDAMPGGSITAERVVTLQTATEHEVRVTWVMNATITISMPQQPEIDTSMWPADLRKRHEEARATIKDSLEPKKFVETGEMRLDRRTGMPIDGTIVTRSDSDSLRMQNVIVYSPITTRTK